MGKLFGTDGIRGKANNYPIIPEMGVKIGRAIAKYFKGDTIVIGKDTRISGNMIESALISGACSMGVNVLVTGILPTPGIAHITSSTDASAGIVISASHNPYEDNGIKIFNGNGFKLTDEQEQEIENLISDDTLEKECAHIQKTGSVEYLNHSEQSYIDFLKNYFNKNYQFKPFKIVIDCSNGSTSSVAPLLLSELGMEVITLFAEPDGININDNCGSQHAETLSIKVVETNSDFGFAFDGDGDRLIAVDEKGHQITGDQIIAICGKFAKAKGYLKNNTVVTTVMSNIGLVAAFKKLDIVHFISDVGDRFVLQDMLKTGAVIGGEDSGHMIFLDHHTTGDGLFCALRLLEVMNETSKPLSEIAKIMSVYPQKLMNVEVTVKPDVYKIPAISAIIHQVETELGNSGRILIRYSGTQLLCRVMVEGPTSEITEKCCRRITDVVQQTIGK